MEFVAFYCLMQNRGSLVKFIVVVSEKLTLLGKDSIIILKESQVTK